MAENNERPIPPPYLPYRTFKGYLDGLKTSGIPARIDRSILRNRSGTEQVMLLNALQYLGLIRSDGTPTDALPKLVVSEGEERQKRFRDMLSVRYPFLFGEGFSLQSATPGMMQSAFSEAGVTGDTVRKAVAFFVASAIEAGVQVSPYLKVRAPRGTSLRRRQRVGPAVNGEPEEETSRQPRQAERQAERTVYQTLIDILDPEAMEKEEQEAVWTLIRYLKRKGQGA